MKWSWLLLINILCMPKLPAGAESDEESDMDVFAPSEECNNDCIRATADSRRRRCRHGCRYCRHCKGMTERDVFCECETS